METIEAWAETVKETNHDKIIYRPHPSTSKSLALNIEKILEQRGLDYIILDKANIEVLLLFQEVVKDMTTTWKGKARTGKDLDKLISTPFRNMTEKLRLNRATKRRKRL